jgi:uncharacterized Ntn-hydrolase superfamily protein
MTYSIVARDPRTGQLGVAVQSHWFSVGTVVTWAEAGVGAVATQAFADPTYGPLGLDLMRAGRGADAALSALVASDPDASRRQVAMVDRGGGVAAHTGGRCIAAAGHVLGEGVSAQANMMLGRTVWPAMLEAYEAASGDLADRLLAALDAGEAAGGDIRGRQSAALLVVAAESTGRPWVDRLVDLRVEDSPEPLVELRRLLALRGAYDRADRAEAVEIQGDVAGALAEFSAARALAPEADELTFWQALLLARSGRVAEARGLLAPLRERHAGWAELVRRLPNAGLFPDDPGLIDRLLG